MSAPVNRVKLLGGCRDGCIAYAETDSNAGRRQLTLPAPASGGKLRVAIYETRPDEGRTAVWLRDSWIGTKK